MKEESSVDALAAATSWLTCRLPGDIIYEVLVRLTVMILIKFKCVSSAWSDLISNSFFITSYNNRSKRKRPTILACSYNFHLSHDEFALSFASYDIKGNLVGQFEKKHTPKYMNSVFTCMDLVCLTNHHTVLLCNPSTQELITLPDHGISSPILNIGFGYAASTKEFKVLCVFGNQCMVFALIRGSRGIQGCWREVGHVPFPVSIWPETVGQGVAFANGAIHMIADSNRTNISNIALFDPDREKWGQLEPPRIYNKPTDLRELRGCLCAVCSDQGTKIMDLWLLNKAGEWINTYQIHFGPLMINQSLLSIVPLLIEDDGSLLVQLTLKNQMVKSTFFRVLFKSSGQEINQVEGFSGLTCYKTSMFFESFFSLSSPGCHIGGN